VTVPVRDDALPPREAAGWDAPVAAPPTALGPVPPRGAEPRRRTGPRPGAAYAALDLGTNNCRLLVAEPSHFGFRVVDAFSRIVRLGEGLGHGDRLTEGAIERTIEALKVCRAKMEARRVGRFRLVATEACRLAANGPAFIARVRDEVGLDLEVLDRRTEAFLAVTGCAALADPRAHAVIVFDIGGGSTEIAWLDGLAPADGSDPSQRVRAWDSLPVGVVTLAERHGGVEVTPPVFARMVEEVSGLLQDFARAAGAAARAPAFHLLGTSGTVTTVGGIHLGLARYDRRRVDGMWMRDVEIDAVLDRLLGTGFDQRAKDPCIGRDRADLVLAAAPSWRRSAAPSRRPPRIADRGCARAS
jgi:exopolyphosphatase/guanosine-5'-triphosphate,3'-diphosphate pyrophosphatase